MTLSDFAIVILDAGKGTRLHSQLPKVLHRAGGRTLVEQVIGACREVKPACTIAVVGHEAEMVSAVVEPLGVRTVLQKPQRGTGHAMAVARNALRSRARFAIVLPGDAPLIRPETLRALAQTHTAGGAAATILSAVVPNPAGYGRILRSEDGSVAAIVEDSALAGDQREIAEINSSIYAFTLEKLWPCLGRLRPENKHHELYLTDAIAMLREQGETVLAQRADDPEEVLGCNTRADLAEADLILRRRKRAELMDGGVSILMPETVLVDGGVSVEPDALLEPGVQLLGKTHIGAGCTIRSGSIISDSTLDEGVLIKPYSLISGSRIAAGAQIGPFAHIRDGARLMEGARVGNFVEVKKSMIGRGVKAMHLSYLGDARIGEASNIGAGTITCNYDGVRKNPTVVGRRVFVGSDTALVAPVRVGDGAYIAAGSTVTENVPADALAIARGRQANKPGWAANRRRELAKAGSPSRDHRARRTSKRPRTKRKSRAGR